MQHATMDDDEADLSQGRQPRLSQASVCSEADTMPSTPLSSYSCCFGDDHHAEEVARSASAPRPKGQRQLPAPLSLAEAQGGERCRRQEQQGVEIRLARSLSFGDCGGLSDESSEDASCRNTPANNARDYLLRRAASEAAAMNLKVYTSSSESDLGAERREK